MLTADYLSDVAKSDMQPWVYAEAVRGFGCSPGIAGNVPSPNVIPAGSWYWYEGAHGAGGFPMPATALRETLEAMPAVPAMTVRILVGGEYAYAIIKGENFTSDVRLHGGCSASKSLRRSAEELRRKADDCIKRASRLEQAATLC